MELPDRILIYSTHIHLGNDQVTLRSLERLSDTVYATLREGLDIEVLRDFGFCCTEVLIKVIGTYIELEGLGARIGRGVYPEEEGLLLTDLDIPVVEVNALLRSSRLRRRPCRQHLISTRSAIGFGSFELEDVHCTLSREGLSLEGDFVWGVGHIPTDIGDGDTYDRAEEVQGHIGDVLRAIGGHRTLREVHRQGHKAVCLTEEVA